MKSSNINPSAYKLLHAGNIFSKKMLVVCNNFITFAPVKQKIVWIHYSEKVTAR